MPQTNAQPRPAGATVLSLFAIAIAALVLAPSSFAAPPEGAAPQLAISPAPATLPTTTVGYQSQTREFVVVNEGEGEASIDKAFFAGPDAGEFNLGGSSCNGAVLQQGQQCSVWISFTAANPGPRQAVLGLQLFGQPDAGFELEATGALPHLSFDPGSYDFGLQPIYREALRTTFQLENDGEAGTQVNSLNIVGENTNGFWIGNSNCYGSWLEPGQSCSVEVDFGPGEAGARSPQLQASSNGQSFSADLSGEGGQAIVAATPSLAEFDATTVGATSAVQAVLLSNSGNVPTSFFIGVIAGGDAGSFQLLDEDCSGAPLMPAASCTAHVRFRPQSAGPKTARLAFFGDSEGGAMVGLSGEGVTAAVTLVPSRYDFASQLAGTRSPTRAFAVRNDGSTPLDLDGVAIVGADLDQFALAGEECSGETLAPGAECLVRIRFAPDSAGAKAATLRVRGESGAFAAALGGTAVGADARSATGTVPSARASGGGEPKASSQAGEGSPARGRGRHRRFARGDSLPGSRRQRPPRVGVRASAARR
jgi:hypothetical protein